MATQVVKDNSLLQINFLKYEIKKILMNIRIIENVQTKCCKLGKWNGLKAVAFLK